MNVDITSRVQGRTFRHVTRLVSAQIQKLIHKKHTLPSYKIRFNPFFRRPEQALYENVSNNASSIAVDGILDVTVVESSRLNPSLVADGIFCTLALGIYEELTSKCISEK